MLGVLQLSIRFTTAWSAKWQMWLWQLPRITRLRVISYGKANKILVAVWLFAMHFLCKLDDDSVGIGLLVDFSTISDFRSVIRASDTLTRSFARYKFVIYLIHTNLCECHLVPICSRRGFNRNTALFSRTRYFHKVKLASEYC